jgi:[lysine-biosynthesis-protein LysW]--L-2-aminoadipate ligase
MKGTAMETVGVLCARGRVEEKALMAALAEAGIVSALFPPTDEPLPVGPFPVSPDGQPFPVPQIVVDRHPNRQIARAVLATCRALGIPALSAGIAATGDRLDVASTLAAHGLPRPATALCTTEEAALAALTGIGLPATLLPLDLQTPAIPLFDVDAAEAILEHRAVLGGAGRSLGLIQAGLPTPSEQLTVIVVDGVATAVGGTSLVAMGDAVPLAEETARALRAELVGVVIASVGGRSLVWDVNPVPEFRDALPIAGTIVADVITRAVVSRLPAPVIPELVAEPATAWIAITREGMRGDVVVSA